ncbi:MAG: Hsp20/alpha crystallin family protein [Deltaproteobacteria bacterium]|jgi:HSP20 family protein|nr:Hsp20/alpha crystallin family protein [Deltaproteobacteria bacterium]
MENKEMQVVEKQEVESNVENIRRVPLFVPPVDIYESNGTLTLVADMPGVSIENLTIDLDKDTLTIRGATGVEETGGRTLLREYVSGDYYRQFSISNLIDREKIDASIKDGVLRLTLPKAESAKPRKIEVKAV